MNWEKLTSKDFEKAVKETKTCVIAFGVVEKHSMTDKAEKQLGRII